MMKKTEMIPLGDLRVSVTSVADAANQVVRCKATCGDSSVEGSHTLHPNHTRTVESVRADHDAFVKKLSEEAAGKERSRLILTQIFA